MIKRQLGVKIKDHLSKFPVVSITGPRQSGKTTLAKKIAPDFQYFNLENISTRKIVTSDPVGFLDDITKPAIIDEVQKFPDLLSQLQVHVDQSDKAGQFIITGSESLLLSEKISQSLAGRVSNNILLPFSITELESVGLDYSNKNIDIKEQILKGFYPRIYDTKQTFGDFYPEYINTYIEKDIRKIQNIGQLSLFEKFLQLVAGRVGQVVNLTSLSNDVGVSHTTIERWISILEATYIIYRLKPYYNNLGKRLIRAPKIYFYDTGILCSLLGINSIDELRRHFAYGSIYENLIISEVYKHIYHNKLSSKLYFYRDNKGVEVDLIIDQGVEKIGIEIKASATYSPEFIKNIELFNGLFKSDYTGYVLYNGQSAKVKDYRLLNIGNIANLLGKIE